MIIDKSNKLSQKDFEKFLLSHSNVLLRYPKTSEHLDSRILGATFLLEHVEKEQFKLTPTNEIANKWKALGYAKNYLFPYDLYAKIGYGASFTTMIGEVKEL